jgi:hypothetical protein
MRYFRATAVAAAFAFFAMFVLLSSCNDSGGGNGGAGPEENELFFGVYQFNLTVGSCTDFDFETEFGSDSSKQDEAFMGENPAVTYYLVLPGSSDVLTYTFKDEDDDSVTRTVSISGRIVSVTESWYADASNHYWSNIAFSFSDDYQVANVDGYIVDTDTTGCSGKVTGQGWPVSQ